MESTKAAPSATHDGSGFPDESSRDMDRSDAVQLAEADMHRQPRIDPSKPLKDRIYGSEWFVGGLMIVIAVALVAFGLKKTGVW